MAAIDLLEYLSENKQWHKLLIHGLSVGAYGFMEVMAKVRHIERTKEINLLPSLAYKSKKMSIVSQVLNFYIFILFLEICNN